MSSLNEISMDQLVRRTVVRGKGWDNYTRPKPLSANDFFIEKMM
jgi:hypothetical protein